MSPTTTNSLLESARRPDTTPFDYIVIGSGAGGGPLAARLAEEGCRVLVLEAGVDALAERGAGSVAATDLEAPLLHGKSVEDPEIAWDYRVRHYADPKIQSKDTKAVPELESPDQRPAVNKPRSAALGGCTAHHAMITAYGCDDAWEAIRDLTGDDAWHPARMRLYFQRVENCEYRKPFTSLGRLWRRILAFFALKPQAVLQGEHGQGGWLNTIVTDPQSAIGDHQLLKVLAGAFEGAKRAGIANPQSLAKAILKAKLDQYLDVNDASSWPTNAEGVRLIPLGVKDGKRFGVRERLLSVAEQFPDRLIIETAIHVTKLAFADNGDPTLAPRVVGVEWTRGKHLYKASPLHAKSVPGESGRYYARREVILCGGSFNTPQLLMLSGIGPKEHLESVGVPCRVNLPGVGGNLQDRYEVCVVSELTEEFKTLVGVNFDPKDTTDEQLKRWRSGDRNSLYASNGGALAILKKTDPKLAVPDIFMFAAPAMFRGYYPGWSNDLLRRPRHGSAPGETPDPMEYRNQLAWVILKSRTNNMSGTVRLRSKDPFATPIVNHHHFGEGAEPGSAEAVGAREDLTAMTRGVAFARSLNQKLGSVQKAELWPGPQIPDDSPDLEQWVRHETWGHHPCGTCRIGSDAWQPIPEELKDTQAVLDTRFRVHGVRGLRVVDASVFPRIPGYFIVTPIYCISEKAADDILADFELYPRELEQAEADAIARRREVAQRDDYDPDPEEPVTQEVFPAVALAESANPGAAAPSSPAGPNDLPAPDRNSRNPFVPSLNAGSEGKLPRDTVGLALSGGGIRSATFCLGVLQGLATLRKLRKIDFISAASGGGYIASFIGRLFLRRLVTVQANPAIAVEQVLRDLGSAPLRWLRSQADYIDASGPTDDRQNTAVYLRNLFTIHVILGVFALAIFGLLRGVGDWLTTHELLPVITPPLLGPNWTSPWWFIPVGILFLGILPLGLGYWAAPRSGRDEAYNPVAFLAGITVLLFVTYGFAQGGPHNALVIGLITVVLALLWIEAARFGSKLPQKLLGPGTHALPESQVIRNRVTRALGECLAMFGMITTFLLIDALARYISANSDSREELQKLWGSIGSIISGLYAAAVFIGPWVRKLTATPEEQMQRSSIRLSGLFLNLAAALSVGTLILALDTASHSLFDRTTHGGWITTLACFVFSLCVARGFAFVNNSSLQATYAARLTRTFLGASNPERIHHVGENVSNDIRLSHPEDDLPLADYQPEQQGGPLHLINTCLNETIDAASLRDVRGRRGMAMSCGPCGVSVGRRVHALWDGQNRNALRSIHGQVEEFDPFRTLDGGPLPVEPMTLGNWTAISGAAFTTGAGKIGSPASSLLAGLTNIRLGYWWDTNPAGRATQREIWPNLWEAVKRLPWRLFRVQNMLIREFRDRFHGPHNRLWYLSDGGHFDNSAVYELIRRRLPLIIACDAGADADFSFDNTAQLVRLARIDFGAEIEFLTPNDKGNGWYRFGRDAALIPEWIRAWLNPDALGSLDQVSRTGGYHASLARISYCGGGPGSLGWLVFLKSGMTGDESLDLLSYRIKNPNFPNDSTLDQSYDEAQWECYRCLGEHVSRQVLR